MNQAECPDKKKDEEEDIHGRCLVAHGWCCSKCGGSKVDDVAFEKSMSRADYEPKDAGFFYCPYDPEFLRPTPRITRTRIKPIKDMNSSITTEVFSTWTLR